MKRIFAFQVIGVFVLVSAGVSLAMPHCGMEMRMAQAEGAKETAGITPKVVDVGNKVCPVGGEKIDDKMKATYEYEGKIYNFCCAMCIDDFKKDPQKYIKKIEEEKAREAAVENTQHRQEEGPGHTHD